MLISAVLLEPWPAQECRWSPLTACIMGPLLVTTGLGLFALVLAVGAYQVRPIGRIILVVTLLLGVAGAALVFRHIYAQRDAFLQRQPGAVMHLARGHVFWHSVYVGLSYVKNSEVPEYRDE